MNKEEIINALVACNNSKGRRCSECPALGKYQHGICKRMVDKETVTLIKCQQEEINRLKVALDDWCMIYKDYPICNFYTGNDCKDFKEGKNERDYV